MASNEDDLTLERRPKFRIYHKKRLLRFGQAIDEITQFGVDQCTMRTF